MSKWLDVPFKIKPLYIKYAPVVEELAKDGMADGYLLETEEIGPVIISPMITPLWKEAAAAKAPAAKPPQPPFAPSSAPIVPVEIDRPSPDKEPHFKVIGPNDATSGVGPAIGTGLRAIQTPFGGPNPLTATLLSAAISAGLGGGAGWLANKLFPEYVDKRAKKIWALIAGLGGAIPPILLHAVPAIKQHGWRGIFKETPLQKMPASSDAPDSFLDHLVQRVSQEVELPITQERMLQKIAFAGAEFLPTVPTDEWGRTILNDPYLTDPEKGLVAGLPFAATAYKGSSWVSPMDILYTGAQMGLGAVGGGIGSVAAKFLGFGEPVQKGIQQAGLLAGAVRGVLGLIQ